MDPRVHGIELSIWRYDTTKNGWVGLHFTGTPAAYSLLLTILDELARAHDGVTRKTIPLQPLRFDRTGFGERAIPFDKLKLEVVDPTDELRHMHASREGTTATIVVTRPFLPELTEAFASARDGAWDTGFSAPRKKTGARDKESLEIWFW